MKQTILTIVNETGLHSRPANQFVQAAQKFDSNIKVTKGSTTVDAKGILGILTLGAGKGSEITIQADGADEDQAIEALSELINTGIKE